MPRHMATVRGVHLKVTQRRVALIVVDVMDYVLRLKGEERGNDLPRTHRPGS